MALVVEHRGPFTWEDLQRITDATVLQPDILVVPAAALGTRHLEMGPLLVVEVLSPTTPRYDLSLKRSAYDESGVESYWVVDPDVPSITVYERGSDGHLMAATPVEGSAQLDVAWPFPVSVVPVSLVPAARA